MPLVPGLAGGLDRLRAWTQGGPTALKPGNCRADQNIAFWVQRRITSALAGMKILLRLSLFPRCSACPPMAFVKRVQAPSVPVPEK